MINKLISYFFHEITNYRREENRRDTFFVEHGKILIFDRCGQSFSTVVIDFVSIFSLRGLISEPYFTGLFFLNFHFDTWTN